MFRNVLVTLTAIVFIVLGTVQTSLAAEKVLVAFGDSTTALRDEDNVVVYATLLEKAFTAQATPVQVVNAGIGGNNTSQGRARFEKDVVDRKPSLVVVQFGLNDSAVDVWKNPPATAPRVSEKQYEDNLRYFIQTLKAKGIEVLLMTPNPGRWSEAMKKNYGKPPYRLDDPDGYNVLVSRYAEIVRQIAAQEKVTLIDIYDVFQKYGKEPGKSTDELLLADGIHPNSKGHALIAKLLLASKPMAETFTNQQSAAAPQP